MCATCECLLDILLEPYSTTSSRFMIVSACSNIILWSSCGTRKELAGHTVRLLADVPGAVQGDDVRTL
jgi:hypothetical protein